jgi:hypothetical protein
LLNALLIKAMLLRCNSILRYSFAVPYLASRNLALAFLCASTLLLYDSQKCASMPLHLKSVLSYAFALLGYSILNVSIAFHFFTLQFSACLFRGISYLFYAYPLLRFSLLRLAVAKLTMLILLRFNRNNFYYRTGNS